MTPFERSSTGRRADRGRRAAPAPGPGRDRGGRGGDRGGTAHLRSGATSALRLGFLAFTLVGTTRRSSTEFGRKVPDVTVQMRQYEWDDPPAGCSPETRCPARRRRSPAWTGCTCSSWPRSSSATIVPEHAMRSPACPRCTSCGSPRNRGSRPREATDPAFAAFWNTSATGAGTAGRAPPRPEPWEAAGWPRSPSTGASTWYRPGSPTSTDGPASRSTRRTLPTRLALAWRKDDAPPAQSDWRSSSSAATRSVVRCRAD